MTLVTKARTVGGLLGRGGRQLRGLRAFFAKRGRPPNYLRLGVESHLDAQRRKDFHLMRVLAERTKVRPSTVQSFEWMFTEAQRRGRVAETVRGFRAKHGAKDTRKMLKRVGMEFRKHSYKSPKRLRTKPITFDEYQKKRRSGAVS